MNVDIHLDNEDKGYKTHTNQSAGGGILIPKGTHNSQPKNYS